MKVPLLPIVDRILGWDSKGLEKGLEEQEIREEIETHLSKELLRIGLNA